ncbi:protein of unknown function (DUF5106) [Bacteroides ovatus]|nr:protein of unknown function (DUF5106) [Bacteroides ovatus]
MKEENYILVARRLGNEIVNNDMKKMRNRLRSKLECFVNEYGAYTAAVILSGFLTLSSFSLITLILFAACKQNQANGSDDGISVRKDTVHIAQYIRPEIPPMMTDPQQRASYYVKHYWDGYSLADTAFIRSDDTEQLFSDFIGALQYVAPEESNTALKRMMSRMEEDSTAYSRFCFLSEKYLYDPNSPMRSEEYFIPILEQMVDSKRLDEYEKIRPADRLAQAHKNRPGMKATDFSYVTLKGKVGRMSGINADYTLLFFYEPDCTNCRKHEQILAELPAFVEMQEKGVLRVLAVYPDDNEEEWLLKSSAMPRGWIVGWNKQGDIRNKTLYEIRATPTMYLLDKEKKVILKDATLEQTIQYLSAVYPGATE